MKFLWFHLMPYKELPATAATLILWGEQDRLLPRSYAGAIAGALGAKAEIEVITGAGHLAELDAPDAVAAAILDFMD
jgi:pimeloyl-ACP methyl ester carboxylesterase